MRNRGGVWLPGGNRQGAQSPGAAALVGEGCPGGCGRGTEKQNINSDLILFYLKITHYQGTEAAASPSLSHQREN